MSGRRKDAFAYKVLHPQTTVISGRHNAMPLVGGIAVLCVAGVGTELVNEAYGVKVFGRTIGIWVFLFQDE